MKLVSWNVNGLRACLNKGFIESVTALEPDILCLQETKMQPGQAEVPLSGYFAYYNSADKKGYSGTAVFSKIEPLRVMYDIGDDRHRGEGRVITLELDDFYLVNVYTPNAQRGLQRLPYRMEWEDAFLAYVKKLDSEKPVVICGDLNVAHQEIDLKNPKSNTKNAGFSPEERAKMTALLESGFLDTFRYFYPDVTGAYTWWSYMFNARENNAGWRIDYFLASLRLKERLINSEIFPDIFGSDHCPVRLTIESPTRRE